MSYGVESPTEIQLQRFSGVTGPESRGERLKEITVNYVAYKLLFIVLLKKNGS